MIKERGEETTRNINFFDLKLLSELALVIVGISSHNAMQYPVIWQTFIEHLVCSRHSIQVEGFKTDQDRERNSTADYIPESLTSKLSFEE